MSGPVPENKGKQQQSKLKAIPHHLEADILQSIIKGLGLASFLAHEEMPAKKGVHISKQWLHSLSPSRTWSDFMMGNDSEELPHTLYFLLESSCQDFPQNALPSVNMIPLYTYDLSVSVEATRLWQEMCF
jgi:hypothetical protein